MFELDDRDVKRYAADLKTFARRAYPFATKATVNRAAFETRKGYQEGMRDDLTLRNKWTERSVRVDQAKTLIVSRQEAIVGSMADYMATQEFGGTVKGKGKHQPIATSYSAGLGQNTRPRTKLPRKPNQLKNIQLKRRGQGTAGRNARNAAAIREAAGSGNKFVFLDLGRRQGIFRVLGGKRRPYIRMVWDLSSKSVRVPRKPLLLPATRATEKQIPQYYGEAALFQLKRHRILGYR